ncbi:MvdC/MvdD family ATP grasp protein [Burkholderia ubonensis]|uniref:MvdC/MvdD family ATP grasp protein n=1 Tax=Burkholderia ubonensis TaxID=101571 RepID=UPI000B04275C|nr:hypothetical protein [Burkholderia ubonensis]
MQDRPFVLVVSTIADIATDQVVRHLNSASIDHYRINTEDLPFSQTAAFYPDRRRDEWLTLAGKSIPAPTSIWYRRVRVPAVPDGMDPGIYKFCVEESRALLLGSITSRETRWMSAPTSVWQAEHKPFQLSVAAELGFRIPRTVITNDPNVIRDAFHELGGMIVKPVRSGYVVHDGVGHSVFTSQLLAEHLDELDSARLSPSIYQELIPKRFDIRVTIVGRQIFSAAIDSQTDSDAIVDWRKTANPDLPHYKVDLPQDVSQKLLQLMDVLQLNFAAIDLVETPTGEYVFLEVNPNGQWLWLDDRLEFGISDAVAAWLGGVGVAK